MKKALTIDPKELILPLTVRQHLKIFEGSAKKEVQTAYDIFANNVRKYGGQILGSHDNAVSDYRQFESGEGESDRRYVVFLYYSVHIVVTEDLLEARE